MNALVMTLPRANPRSEAPLKAAVAVPRRNDVQREIQRTLICGLYPPMQMPSNIIAKKSCHSCEAKAMIINEIMPNM